MQHIFSRVLSSKFLKMLFVASGMGLVAQLSFAIPVYYTFSGEVSYVSDRAGIASDSGVAVGDGVSYTFLVDRDLPGQARDSRNADYFYSELVAGGLISSTVPSSSYELNTGVEVDGRRFDSAQLSGDLLSDATFAYSNEASGQDMWQIGALWAGIESAIGKGRRGLVSTVLYSRLKLTEIASAPKSVPELDVAGAPLALSLILGLIGLGMERRRKSYVK